ncbi:serine/arginine repetitive matrix protein 1 isoform X3 [Salvelinus sp. IW2-2015]|uniref:serine/arginine repetitive matrix protein 1 isoform X3 n=1 Tax=Salvelinus sp. IW2-2015 TaxID=2691554 RepID=UPI000CDFA8C7|nr:serine/arginine repetitive matrix protein 1 isoform X3 [Salvelinus alpinus]XP_023830669.1 serine/arginine repetitive matrix protein 1 isoform X3 [Salvelinus alpinus]XP_023830679.1 serine/arginine repetitive matrix protein 1 isoform X3 [Salvelinus alpinus]
MRPTNVASAAASPLAALGPMMRRVTAPLSPPRKAKGRMAEGRTVVNDPRPADAGPADPDGKDKRASQGNRREQWKATSRGRHRAGSGPSTAGHSVLAHPLGRVSRMAAPPLRGRKARQRTDRRRWRPRRPSRQTGSRPMKKARNPADSSAAAGRGTLSLTLSLKMGQRSQPWGLAPPLRPPSQLMSSPPPSPPLKAPPRFPPSPPPKPSTNHQRHLPRQFPWPQNDASEWMVSRDPMQAVGPHAKLMQPFRGWLEEGLALRLLHYYKTASLAIS